MGSPAVLSAPLSVLNYFLTLSGRLIRLAGCGVEDFLQEGSMTLRYRPIRAGFAAALGLATTAAVVSLGTVAMASHTAAPATVALVNSVPATTDHMTGAYSSQNMTIQVVLSPRNAAGLAGA